MDRREQQMRALRALPPGTVWCDDAPVTVRPDVEQISEANRHERFSVDDKADVVMRFIMALTVLLAASIAAWLALEIYGAVVGRVTTELAVTPETAIAMMEAKQ